MRRESEWRKRQREMWRCKEESNLFTRASGKALCSTVLLKLDDVSKEAFTGPSSPSLI